MRLFAVALALIVACATAEPAASPGAPRSVTRSAAPTANSGPATASAEVVVRGLEAPWAMDLAPDGRLFVTERPGRIRIVRDGALQSEAWATLTVVARPDEEEGLLGLALDPAFARTRTVFVYYSYRTEAGRLVNRIARLRDENGRGVDAGVIVDGIPAATNHDGGRLRFGPDGFLYAGTGDANQPQLAQQRDSLAGKILRLRREGGAPSGNPFGDSLVFSLGHRNVQGLAFDLDGILYATEHGPSGDPARGQACCHDEVNRIEAGANYGWPLVYGAAGAVRFRDPVHESGNDTWAPSGATFITRAPYRGNLVFATLSGQHLHRLVLVDGRVAFEERLLTGFGRLRDVLENPDGSLYVLTHNRDGRAKPGPDDDRLLRVTLR